MVEGGLAQWRWEVARDVVEVHELLRVCDEFQAARSGTPVPARSFEHTRQLVDSEAVNVLRADGVAVAMFSLTWDAPSVSGYPPGRRPARLGRLAVRPSLLESGSLAGVQCVRKAVELARVNGADVLRAEANPDLVQTRALLDRLGFEQDGPVESDGARRRVRLRLRL